MELFTFYTPLFVNSKLFIVIKCDAFGQEPNEQYRNALTGLTASFQKFNAQNDITSKLLIKETISHCGDIIISLGKVPHQTINLLDDFLSTLGLQEFSENPRGHDFYNSAAGANILNPANYPEFLRNYLMEEGRHTENFIRKANHYTALVEIGCGTGRAIWMAENQNLNYYGIDICEKDIETLNLKIKDKNNTKTVKGLHMSVFDLGNNNPIPPEEKPLYIFPFNVFGNIGKSLKLISLMKLLNADFIVTSYRTDEHSSEVRQHYFEKCAFQDLHLEKSPFFTKFTSHEGLSSTACNQDYFSTLIEGLDLDVEPHKFGDIGMMYFVTQRPEPRSTSRPIYRVYSSDDHSVSNVQFKMNTQLTSSATPVQPKKSQTM
jgi:SAM-dependent methyltransferase